MNQHPYQHGEFCWYELGTRDIAAARKFYMELMQWETVSHEMGESGIYYIFQSQGMDVGAGYQMSGPQFEGVPPHWMPYLWADDVDATAQKMAELGAAILYPPTDMPNIGRMAMIRDPQGAHFALYTGREYPGAARMAPKPGFFCWTELMTTDTTAARSFYGKTLGWTFKEAPLGPDQVYTVYKIEKKNVAGMMELRGPQFEGIPPHWNSYLSVVDCDASMGRAVQLGATLCVPPQDVPGTGRFAVLQDPTGAAFAIIALIAM